MSKETSSQPADQKIQEHTITCIGCSMECEVSFTVQNGEILTIGGNNCPTGEMHARSTLAWLSPKA